MSRAVHLLGKSLEVNPTKLNSKSDSVLVEHSSANTTVGFLVDLKGYDDEDTGL